MNLQRFEESIQKIGISNAELGRKVGVSRQTISQYRKGERNPSKYIVELMAMELGVDASWLLGYDVEEIDKMNISIIFGLVNLFEDTMKKRGASKDEINTFRQLMLKYILVE